MLQCVLVFEVATSFFVISASKSGDVILSYYSNATNLPRCFQLSSCKLDCILCEGVLHVLDVLAVLGISLRQTSRELSR